MTGDEPDRSVCRRLGELLSFVTHVLPLLSGACSPLQPPAEALPQSLPAPQSTGRSLPLHCSQRPSPFFP